MGKILEVRNLYKETLNDITKSVDDWKAFLNSASWNFKYSFDDQVLIYAQRPDATACAEMTEWNQKVKRWVNKNAKVIFVKAKDSSEYPYRMVFDVSDTHNYQNTPYKLWQIKKEFEKDIIETLENSFGEIDDKDNLAQAIILSSYNMVMDNMQDYLMSISKYKENSKLENMSNDEIQAIFMSTLWASVSYMMLKRAGFDADKEINNSEFSLISNFNNENLISIIGTATSDIAEMGLREIAKTVIYLKKEERKYNRTLESKKEMDYSNIEKEIEGGENNVKYRIQETRRLYDTKYNVRGGENSNRKVRTNEVEFLKNTEKSRIPNIMERQEVSRTFNADTRTSNNNDKSNYSEISGERWIDRENKTGRTNEMDRLNEQLQDDSGRTSNKGINLHLELLTEKEQMEKIADTDNSVPAIFEFTQEMIDMTLQNGSGFEDGKFRIYKQITSSLSSKDNVEFLKQEYGIGGSSSAYIGANFGQDHNSKGIKLYKG